MAENDKQEIDSKGSSDPKENTRSTIAKICYSVFCSRSSCLYNWVA